MINLAIRELGRKTMVCFRRTAWLRFYCIVNQPQGLILFSMNAAFNLLAFNVSTVLLQ